MNKNDIVTVEITDIGVSGEGIGHVDGYTLFIKDAVIGDVVEAKVMKAKKNYGYARLMKVITPSEYRVEPKCAFARRCGGCQIQEMSYDRQLVFKDQKIRGNLERIGGFTKDQIDTVISRLLEWSIRLVIVIKHSSRSERTKKAIRSRDSMPEEHMILLQTQIALLA
mgnify:CR=1 FL=1